MKKNIGEPTLKIRIMTIWLHLVSSWPYSEKLHEAMILDIVAEQTNLTFSIKK